MRKRGAAAAILLAMCTVPAACNAIIGLGEPTVGTHDAGRDAGLDLGAGDDAVSEGAAHEGGSADGCSPGTCGPVVLVADAGDVVSMSASSGSLYWVDGLTGQVRWCPTSACSNPSVLFTPQGFDAGNSTVGGIATLRNNVFIGDNTPFGPPGPYVCNQSSCSPLQSSSSEPYYVGAIAADTVDVYWTEPGAVYACAVSGCFAASTLGGDGWVSGNNRAGLAAAGGRIYFAGSPPVGTVADVSVGWCTLNGCGGGGQWLQSVGEPTTAVGANASGVFWATATKVYASTPPMPSVSPPPAKLVASGLNGTTSFAADDLGVFFASSLTGGGTIYACASPSCSNPEVIATNVGNVSAIAVDSARVYAAIAGSVEQIVWVAR